MTITPLPFHSRRGGMHPHPATTGVRSQQHRQVARFVAPVVASVTPSGSDVHPRPGTPTSLLEVVRIEGSPIATDRTSTAAGDERHTARGPRPPLTTTVGPVYSLRIFSRHKEVSRHMARVTPITARQVDLLMDLQEAFHELATRDGHIDTTEAEVAAIISMVLVKAERIDRTRRIARNLEDSGEMTPWALRNVREMEHDLGNIVRFEDYRHDTDIA